MIYDDEARAAFAHIYATVDAGPKRDVAVAAIEAEMVERLRPHVIGQAARRLGISKPERRPNPWGWEFRVRGKKASRASQVQIVF
jgi:hypothetical protein